MRLTLNTELSEDAMSMMVNGGRSGTIPSLVVMHCINDDIETSSCVTYDTLGMYVNRVAFTLDKGADGVVYDIQGVVKDKGGNVTTIQTGDQIAFNYPNNDRLSEAHSYWNQKMYDGTTAMYGGPVYVSSKAGKTVESYPPKGASAGRLLDPDTYSQDYDKPSFRVKMVGPFKFAIVMDKSLPAKARAYAVMDLQGNVLRQGEIVSEETPVQGLKSGSYIVKVGLGSRRVNIR